MTRFEEIATGRGERSGLAMTIAVHSTALGPALGGVRMWSYEDEAAAAADARRLAEAMTHKASAAGLDLGGGKGVISVPPGSPPIGALRRAALLDFGDLVESLDGRYVTAEDVGVGAPDMEVIAERTSHVVGLDAARGGSGDPSPVTALGVLSAMRACAASGFGEDARDLGGVRVAISGLGHVGSVLARMLTEAGAELTVADINAERIRLAEELGAAWVDPGAVHELAVDVFAPCALGGVIDPVTVEQVRAPIVCGAANNVLSDPALADRLAERQILYAPDFIVNAGGLISVYGEHAGIPHERALELARGIEHTVDSILVEAGRAGSTPLAAAMAISRRRLAGPARVGAGV